MAADPVDIITLDEAKQFLNITDVKFDVELAGFITAASQAWVSQVGPVNSAAYDEWYDGGASRISLRRWPVLAVSLIEESFGTVKYTLTDSNTSPGTWTYTLDKSTGLLIRRAMGVAIGFAGGQQNIHVQYTAGYATVPANIKQAVSLLLKHLWETQRGGARRPGSEPEAGSAYLWPNRVLQMARPYMEIGIF